MTEQIPNMPLPAGARVIEPADAVKAIEAGDHADAAATRNPELDAILILMIESGEIITVRLATGEIAFTRREA